MSLWTLAAFGQRLDAERTIVLIRLTALTYRASTCTPVCTTSSAAFVRRPDAHGLMYSIMGQNNTFCGKSNADASDRCRAAGSQLTQKFPERSHLGILWPAPPCTEAPFLNGEPIIRERRTFISADTGDYHYRSCSTRPRPGDLGAAMVAIVAL